MAQFYNVSTSKMSLGHDMLWWGRVVIWVINSFFKCFIVLHTFINDDGKTYTMAYTNYVIKCISQNVYKERNADSSFRG